MLNNDDKECTDILLQLGVISAKIDSIVVLLKEVIANMIAWKKEHQEETEVVASFLNSRIGKIEQAQAIDPRLSPKGDKTKEQLCYQMETSEFRALRNKEYEKHFR
jgi:hypothetical protein